jgi:hypothetical protein
VPSTERTILSPFTKEYRALGTNIGISHFLECPFLGPNQTNNQSGNLEHNPWFSNLEPLVKPSVKAVPGLGNNASDLLRFPQMRELAGTFEDLLRLSLRNTGPAMSWCVVSGHSFSRKRCREPTAISEDARRNAAVFAMCHGH